MARNKFRVLKGRHVAECSEGRGTRRARHAVSSLGRAPHLIPNPSRATRAGACAWARSRQTCPADGHRRRCGGLGPGP